MSFPNPNNHRNSSVGSENISSNEHVSISTERSPLISTTTTTASSNNTISHDNGSISFSPITSHARQRCNQGARRQCHAGMPGFWNIRAARRCGPKR